MIIGVCGLGLEHTNLDEFEFEWEETFREKLNIRHDVIHDAFQGSVMKMEAEAKCSRYAAFLFSLRTT